MDYHEKSLVVIICESILEEKIIESIKKVGAHGYTILDARGGGSQGERSGEFEYDKNIQIEVLCKEETADVLCQEVRELYFDDYALVVYKKQVEVLRSEKFC